MRAVARQLKESSRLWRVLQRGLSGSPLSEVETLPIEKEPYCRHRTELTLGDRVPLLAPDAFVAPSAIVIGDVDLYDNVFKTHM